MKKILICIIWTYCIIPVVQAQGPRADPAEYEGVLVIPAGNDIAFNQGFIKGPGEHPLHEAPQVLRPRIVGDAGQSLEDTE